MNLFFHTVRQALWQCHKHASHVLCCLLLLVLMGGMAGRAHALPQHYTILAAGIDTSREKAERLAMDYALNRALFLSASKLGVVNAEEKIRQLTPEARALLIRGANVEKTRRDGNRTYQQIRVTVAEDALRSQFQATSKNSETPEKADKGRTVLVVPVLEVSGHVWVWEKENALRIPLSHELLRQAHGLVMMPGGDFNDLRLLDHDNAKTVGTAELKTMFERYGTSEIIIAVLTPSAEGTSDASSILLHRVTATGVRDERVMLPPETPEDTTKTRIEGAAKAIAAAANQIATSTAQDDLTTLARSTQIPVLLVYTTPRELNRLTSAIRTAPHVMQLAMPSITLGQVRGIIYFDGTDKAALQKQLTSRGVIIREQGGVWNASTR